MAQSLPESFGSHNFLGSDPYQHLVEHITDFAIFVVDVLGNIALWNEGAHRLFGYEPAEILGTPLTRLYTPEDRENGVLTKELHGADCEGRAETERWYLRKDNTRFFGDGVTTTLLDPIGELMGYAKVVRDETPRKLVEDELARERERFELLALANNDTVYDWNIETGEVWWNDEAIVLFGLENSPNPSTAAWRGEHIHTEDRQRVLCGLSDVIEGRTKSWANEYRCLRNDGSVVSVHDRGHMLYHPAGHAVRMVGTLMDVTARKRAEQEREQLLDMAEAGARLKDEFLATLSHEMRTPLQSVLGYASLLRTGRLNAEQTAHALEIIERSANEQISIVEDVLDTSRILTGQIRLDIREVDLTHCIGGALKAVNAAATAKEIRIDLDLCGDSCSVMGDAARLQQVIWNLLSNAVKFTAKGGRATLSLVCIGESVQIQVVDTGQGIAPEFLPHVFDRFRQADSSSTRAHGGLGLGLAIVRQMVELHGGTIEARSEGVGRGATFTVRIPAFSPVVGE